MGGHFERMGTRTNICQGTTFPRELSSGRESEQEGWSPVPGTTGRRCIGVLGRACACSRQKVRYGKAGIKEVKKKRNLYVRYKTYLPCFRVVSLY